MDNKVIEAIDKLKIIKESYDSLIEENFKMKEEREILINKLKELGVYTDENV